MGHRNHRYDAGSSGGHPRCTIRSGDSGGPHALPAKQLPRQYPPFATVSRDLGWLPGNAHGESGTPRGALYTGEWTYRDGLQHLAEHVEADDHDRSGFGDFRADRGVELRLADVVALHFGCFVGRSS